MYFWCGGKQGVSLSFYFLHCSDSWCYSLTLLTSFVVPFVFADAIILYQFFALTTYVRVFDLLLVSPPPFIKVGGAEEAM